ncbi:hypothetical protein B0H17DRAFT_1155544 [Mycena rosella]|uniref:Uncharacterized protein n=1 Tax=Mycena rosella TaxID=1033263 RepID=A0AAD7H162_MYCRO|nr:hypothetical protein B0H17DRAFT_1155544 [Mycena rosella]
MFEDICLSCGKEVADGRPYCNDVCQNGDLTSPSLSSASSAFSSPHLAYAHGQDVPALVPSALGRALRAYTAHDRYSASSSSASSTSWSVVTDDEDPGEYDLVEFDGLSHSSNPGLSYARRPSGTNNRSTFPHLHRRTDSTESAALICSLPQSAPSERLCPPGDDDDLLLDDSYASDFAPEDPARAPPVPSTSTGTTKARRKRNRASLPAYFSMLQIGASTVAAALPPPYPQASPISTSSGYTLTRPSPPTPKLSVIAGLAHAHARTAPPSAAIQPPPQFPSVQQQHQTPRGRRRESAASPRRLSSSSRSPSPARRRDSDEKVADWSSALARERGRAVRRNSSPPPQMQMLKGSASPLIIDLRRTASRSGSGSGSRVRTRGRARAEELDGPWSPEHPGMGHGRSGLISRARRGVEDSSWVPL